MKKIYAIFLCILITCSTISCSAYELHGIDNFSKYDSRTSLTRYLIPTDDFLTMFEHVDGDYHYYDGLLTFDPAIEKVFIFLQYDAPVYQEAKQYCMDNMYLSESNIKEHNGYIFIENLAYPKKNGDLKNGKNKEFPDEFVMFGYSDSRHTLIFIAFSVGEAPSADLEKKASYAKTDFAKFLDIFYSEYYDFNAK